MRGATNSVTQQVTKKVIQNGIAVIKAGNIVQLTINGLAVIPNTPYTISGLPKSVDFANALLTSYNASGYTGAVEIGIGSTTANVISTSLTPVFGSLIYLTEEGGGRKLSLLRRLFRRRRS